MEIRLLKLVRLDLNVELIVCRGDIRHELAELLVLRGLEAEAHSISHPSLLVIFLKAGHPLSGPVPHEVEDVIAPFIIAYHGVHLL